MARPTKLNSDVTRRIGDGVSLGLTYALAAESAGITYKTFIDWMKLGRDSTSGKYFEFYQHIEKYNTHAIKKCLEHLNEAANAGNCQVCMWILSRRFPEDFGRRVYRKMDVVSENKNENVEIIVKDSDAIRKKILNKLSMVGEF